MNATCRDTCDFVPRGERNGFPSNKDHDVFFNPDLEPVVEIARGDALAKSPHVR